MNVYSLLYFFSSFVYLFGSTHFSLEILSSNMETKFTLVKWNFSRKIAHKNRIFHFESIRCTNFFTSMQMCIPSTLLSNRFDRLELARTVNFGVIIFCSRCSENQRNAYPQRAPLVDILMC